MATTRVRIVGIVFLFFSILAGWFLAYQVVEAVNSYSANLERDNSQYLSIADASQNGALDIAGDVTIEAWVKLESPAGVGESQVIVSKYKGGAADERSYVLSYYNFEGTPRFVFAGDSNGDVEDIFELHVPYTLPLVQWTHVAFVYNADNGTGVLYINGAPVGSASGGDPTIYNGAAQFMIGAQDSAGGGQDFFDGLIDDVRLWNIERTETEISTNMSTELAGNEAGLVGYWRLNNSGVDATANGNNLTENGGSGYSTDIPFAPPPPPPPTELLKVRKDANQSKSTLVVPSNDSSLKLSLLPNTTYIIDGVVFVTSTSGTPDFLMAFDAPSGSVVDIGYSSVTGTNNNGVLGNGNASSRIVVQVNRLIPVHVQGTIVTGGTAGDLQFKWSQATSATASTTVLRGSYLRAESI